MYLINLETGGNQAYIFATNKLRNVVGASELLYRVGTDYVERALKDMENHDAFETIISTSGKALLLAPDQGSAKKFIKAWSKLLVTEAPGVDAVAVCSRTEVKLDLPLKDKSKESYMQVYRETERLMTLQRMKEGRPLVRFKRLPIVAECAFSGLPAVELENVKGEQKAVSVSCLAQHDVSRDPSFMSRIGELFPSRRSDHCLKGLDSLEEQDWLAVVHADGNGLGQLFIDFDKLVLKIVQEERNDEANGRDYVNYYRDFSNALDEISHDAFRETVKKVLGENEDEIVPIVVGGDDLTVVMNGYKSLDFARTFMEEFCKRANSNPNTAYSDVVRVILQKAGLTQLGMCAGISIAKSHFPFSQSYRMAEELMKNAKQVKEQYGKDSIALDFHILYDSVSTSIADIRDRLRSERDGVVKILTAKPYVVSPGSVQQGTNDEWHQVHKFEHFGEYVEALKGEKLKKKLPSSQAHAVREALFSEVLETQNSEWEFLLNTYKDFRKAWYDVRNSDNLYIHVTIPPDEERGKPSEEREYTYFLDALEAMKFLNDQERGGTKA